MDPAERMGVNGTLSIQAKEFQASARPTPSARDWKGATDETFGTNSRPLNEVAKVWSTPRASDAEKGGPNQRFGAGGTPLPAQAQQWATPTSLSFGESHQPGNSRSYNINMDLAQVIYSHLAPVISVGGLPPSKERRSLNPLFVEWLMGWPPGWTLLAWTDFACSETALCRWKQRMGCALSQLGLPAEAPAAQLDLWG